MKLITGKKIKKCFEIPPKFTGIIELMNGDKVWYKKGQIHREDGPAIEFVSGDSVWYKNGKYHREDGPACEYCDGGKAWYLNGLMYSEQEFKAAKSKVARKKKTTKIS